MATATQAMTAGEALRTLHELPRYEERLTARAHGITSMLWGLVAGAIFLTYATAKPLIDGTSHEWVYSLLWIPWVAAGIALTGCVWTAHALTLRRDPETRKGLLMSLGFTGLFLALMGTAYVLLDVVFDTGFGSHAIMVLVNAAFAAAVALLAPRGDGVPAARRHLLVAATVLAACGVALGLSGLPEAAVGLLGAGASAAAWFLAGLATFASG